MDLSEHVTYRAIGVIVAALTFLAPTAGAQVPVNDCADPSNQGTLRCAKYPADRPYVQPGGPTDPDEVKTFTRVFLTDVSARCFDGTAPTLYVDPAVDAAGNSIVSSKWLFMFSFPRRRSRKRANSCWLPRTC